MLMATYRDIHDGLKYEKVLVSRALASGIAADQLSVGLGSVSVAEPARYGWNASDLRVYIDWVVSLNITNIGVWRSDIDVYSSKAKVATAPFFLAALQDFLHGR